MEKVCYVCCEDGGYRVCLCNTVIHEKCFREMVETVESHSVMCPVCQHDYAKTLMPNKPFIIVKSFGFIFVLGVWAIYVSFVIVTIFPYTTRVSLVDLLFIIVCTIWALCFMWKQVNNIFVYRIAPASTQQNILFS